MDKLRISSSELGRLIKESVMEALSDDEAKRKREMGQDWDDIEKKRDMINQLYPSDSKYTQSSLGDALANGWAGAGKTDGALAMDAQLPYEHPFVGKGHMYKKADTSKWSEPSMKGRGYEGPNAARNYARSFGVDKDSVEGVRPIYDRSPYDDNDMNNLDDPDYFDDKIKQFNDKWYPVEKERYKNLKHLSQDYSGKRSKNDDGRSFKRALKAADSRPLHRKGSLNRAFAESRLRDIVKESVRRVLGTL